MITTAHRHRRVTLQYASGANRAEESDPSCGEAQSSDYPSEASALIIDSVSPGPNTSGYGTALEASVCAEQGGARKPPEHLQTGQTYEQLR